MCAVSACPSSSRSTISSRIPTPRSRQSRNLSRDSAPRRFFCRHWALGSAGIEDLAHKVVELAESGQAKFHPLYGDDLSLFEKIEIVASKIYHAGEVTADKAVRDQLQTWEEQGYGNLPICMAKTQYSFSTDPNLRGAPEGHIVTVREVRLSAGAGFVVAITGEIMTMPGLPKSPSAERIFLNDQGYIEGLF
ncbi:formate--tetrahydrofolate ligase [Rhizobium beringeri]|nr:formate--tetrahydrofolate ligase [Rhizobium beringeri]WSH13593.1 formate--tetrahydrofolate ligase [Rhizobium beringeri]